MDEEKAREILKGCIDEEGNLSDSFNNYESGLDYLGWSKGNKDACLDGDFTADQLEAIAWWMRNKNG